MSVLDIEQNIDEHWLTLLGFRRISETLNMWQKDFYVNFKFDYPYEYEPIRRSLSFTLVYDITKSGTKTTNSLSYRLSNHTLWDRYEHHMGIMFNMTDKDMIAFVKGFPEYIKQRVTIIDPHLFYERDERPRC